MASKKQWLLIGFLVYVGVQESLSSGLAGALGGATSMLILSYGAVALYNSRGSAEPA